MIIDMKHESMITRHWDKVKETVKQKFTVDGNLELNLLWNLRLFDYKETIEEIC
jgi:dynein heavy chain